MADFGTEEGENIDAEEDAAYRDRGGTQHRVEKNKRRECAPSLGKLRTPRTSNYRVNPQRSTEFTPKSSLSLQSRESKGELLLFRSGGSQGLEFCIDPEAGVPRKSFLPKASR